MLLTQVIFIVTLDLYYVGGYRMSDLLFSERQKKLDQLAQKDESFCLWKKCYLQCEKEFEIFANSQPEYIRNILWGYAESGRIMNQRMVNLACEKMIFPDE